MENYILYDTVQENVFPRSTSTNDTKKLHDICNWNEIENVVIEYHDLDSTIYIDYKELLAAKTMLSNLLQSIKGFEFIGIHFNVPEYCVVSLMLGILSSKHSFVNIPFNTTEYSKLKNILYIHYLFSKDIIEGDVIKQFTIHNECIYLVKLKDIQQQNKHYNKGNHYAYAITTSGSSGIPKVVKVSHASIVPNILDLNTKLNIKKYDKIAQFTNFTFDPSIIEIFLALSCAATLFIVSKTLKNNTNRFLEEAYSSQISVLQMTPSVFLYNWTSERLKATILSNNTSLRVLLLGGEPFPKLDLLLQAKHPDNNTLIYNIYGITEVSCWASINEVTVSNLQCDIHYLGQVLSETIFQVRNEKGDIVTNGSNSRICEIDDENVADLELPIFRDSGDTVYIDEEDRIFYKGRSNSIVKRFGNKINLTDLEKLALQLDFVKNCYVLWDETCHKLYLCITAKEEVTNEQNINVVIMEHLQKLHPLCRPDNIFFLDHFELTSSGKISINNLKKYIKEKMINTVTNNIDIQTVEQIFKSVWTSNLKCENNGFVKLGGTSIIALHISNTISKEVNKEFPELIGMLLNDATIDECFTYIKDTLLSNSNDSPATLFQYASDNNQIIPLTHTIIKDQSLSTESDTKNLNSETVNMENQVCTYQWHKCRGQLSNSTVTVNDASKLQYKTISKIEILKMYDLRKCIDASPTVFHYSNGRTYVTVGSHSGLIITFLLDTESCFSAFVVQLPNRIEASVLILDDFKGIVGCHDGNVYCFDLKSGKVFWKYQTGDIVKCSAIFCKAQQNIFVGSYDCYIYCLSAKDGSEIWKHKTSNGRISASGCLHSSSNCVLFGALDGSCLALEQSSGKLMWEHKLTDPIFIAPITLNNGLVLFCSVTGTLTCFDITVNAKMWQYKVNGNVFSYIVKQNDILTGREIIILASQDKNVYCFESTNGRFENEPILKFILYLESPVFATPWWEDNILFIACTDGTLYIYDFTTNRLTKTEKLPGEVFSSPVVHNDVVVIGCRDNNVYVLKLTDN
ncbi:aminoadipate-semialdehyde dehydrogenase isoform X2 [Nomia melanderi]|uniref:aminoadipate-semialdehyde dehydrogenase isoform X2 n=1 Tax=Nomia melanderi TaxID=2448451 RepID=UPI003FCCC2B2